MAPVLRAALVLCVMLAAAPYARTQNLQSCYSDVNVCLSSLQSALQNRNSLSEVCRAGENYFNCATRITSCGQSFQDIVQPVIERARTQLRDLGCGAEGTAVVSVVTLLLSLAAALVWGQS